MKSRIISGLSITTYICLIRACLEIGELGVSLLFVAAVNVAFAVAVHGFYDEIF